MKSPEQTAHKLQRESEYTRFRMEVAEQQAADNNCTIEVADDRTLQLDLDSDEAYQVFLQQLDLLSSLGVVWLDSDLFDHDAFVERKSKSGNRHITLKLNDPLPVEHRILLQACLGSDLKRELLSYARVCKGIANPVLLFRPKEG